MATAVTIDDLTAKAGAEAATDRLFAALFDMVEQHCSTELDRSDSFSGWSCHVRAMRLLAEAGFIEIDSDDGARIKAHIPPKARDLMARVAAVIDAHEADR